VPGIRLRRYPKIASHGILGAHRGPLLLILAMNTTRQLLVLASVILCPTLHAQSFSETFDGGSNVGGWTIGNGFDQIVTSGGNPGAYLHNPNIDTFAPQPRTTLTGNAFTGDWRARGVTEFGIDLRTFSTQFTFQRECTLVMYDSNGCGVYYLGTELVPQVAEMWKSFDFAIDSASTTIPVGWFPIGSCADGNLAWNAVMQDVQEVGLFYGDPTFFFIFDIWNIGLDNPRITEGALGTNYCSSTANSTGNAASMSASGSGSIAAEDLTLFAEDLAANQNGLFFYGPNQASAPFGNGLRCIAGGASGIGRLPIVNSGSSGVLTHAVDYDTPPSASTQITAGSTWNFQAWFRDPAAGGAFFDLSDGLEVTFVP
jgi:hypothetical protein